MTEQDWAYEQAKLLVSEIEADWTYDGQTEGVREYVETVDDIAGALRDERERCAKIADDHLGCCSPNCTDAMDIAAAIRGEDKT